MSENSQSKLEILREQVLQDLKFDINEAGKHAFSLITLREKYTHLLAVASMTVKKLEREAKQEYRLLFEHYMKNYQVKIDRRDMKIYIEGDTKLIRLQEKIDEAKAIQSYIDGVVQAIDKHGFSVGHAIKFEIFKRGG